MDTKSMGSKIRMYRAKCGWSIKECAEQAGISARYLADIERGDKVPKLETFLALLNVVAASSDDVLQDSLAAGYEAKSNDIIRKLQTLDVTKRKQALDIFEGVLSSLK